MELFISGYLSVDVLIKAISWTLVHSLWQGLACSLLAGLILLFTRRTSPQLRYGLLTVVLVAFLLANAATLVLELNLSQNSGLAHHTSILKRGPQENGTTTLEYRSPLGAGRYDYGEQFSRFMNDHSSVLVIVWFLIFCFQFARLLAGIGYVNRIRVQRVQEPGPYWSGRINELAKSLGIAYNIRILQSELVKVPMVAGFFKPLILVPLQMMMQLPPGDIEAILLHELAHIRRRDFWVNMVQQIATLFYFFNPGLLWISSLISEERENCCDEMAIRQLGNGKSYISALLSFEELNQPSAPFVLAFPGRKNRLLQRVKRILYHQNQTLNTMEKIILAGCLLLIGLGPLALAQPVKNVSAIPATGRAQIDPVKPIAESAPEPAVASVAAIAKIGVPLEDTVPKKAEKVKYDPNGVKKAEEIVYERDGYRIVTREGKIISAYYNGKKLTNEEIKKQKPELDKIVKKQAIEWKNMKDAADQDYAKLIAEKQKMQEEMARVSAQSVQSKELAELLAVKASRMGLEEQSKMKEINLQMEELKQQLAELQTQKSNLETENNKAILEKMLKERGMQNSQEVFSPISQIIDKLIDKKIIANREELSFELNNAGFTVNNVKQSDAIHDEFRKAFLKGPNDHISYSISKHSSHSEISISD